MGVAGLLILLTFPAAAASRPSINVNDEYGAVGDGVADDTAAIRNALAAAVKLRGKPTLVFAPGVYRTRTLQIPDALTINPDNTGSVIFQSIAAEPLFYESGTTEDNGSGHDWSGSVRGLSLDCANTGTIGLYVGIAVNRSFHDIQITNCTDTGMVLDGTQNSDFNNIEMKAGKVGLKWLNGAGNNHMTRIELSLSTGEAAMIVGKDASLPGYQRALFDNVPTLNTLERSVIEYGTSRRQIWIQDGNSNTFSDINPVMNDATVALIQLDSGATLNHFKVAYLSLMNYLDKPAIVNYGYRNEFSDVTFQMPAGVTVAVVQTAGNIAILNAHISAPHAFRIAKLADIPDSSIFISDLAKAGPTAERPNYGAGVHDWYFDTDLNKNLIYNGKQWVDAMGKPN